MIALLFNMNHLWEEYIFQTLKKKLGQQYLVHQPTKPLFTTKGYRLEPDIVMTERESGEHIVIDTKWKKPRNGKANIHDLRQIYTYNRFWNAEHGFLVYPGHETKVELLAYAEGGGYKCGLVYLDLIENRKKDLDLGFLKVVEDEGGYI